MERQNKSLLFGASEQITEGATGAYGGIQHYQYEINGTLTDIVVSFGGRGIEFYTMDPNTGALTLMSNEKAGAFGWSNDQGYEEGVFFESNGELYYYRNWSKYDGVSDETVTTGNVTYKLDQTTGQWSPIATQPDQDFTSLSNIANPETTGDLCPKFRPRFVESWV